MSSAKKANKGKGTGARKGLDDDSSSADNRSSLSHHTSDGDDDMASVSGDDTVAEELQGLGLDAPDDTEPDEEAPLLGARASGLDRGDRRETGQGETRGRPTGVGRAPPRSPMGPPPNWGPGRGIDAGRSASIASRGRRRFDAPRSESVASRGGSGRDAASGGNKRKNESAHDEGSGSKAIKLIGANDQRRYDDMWQSGGHELQKGGSDKVTGFNMLGGGREKANMVGPFVGGPIDAIATKTTGKSRDAEICVAGALTEAASRSKTGQVAAIFMPINRTSDPTSRTSGGRRAETPQAGPRRFRSFDPAKRPRKMTGSSRSSSQAPWMRAGAQGDRADNIGADRNTAGAKDKETEVVDLTEARKATSSEDRPVDLTGLDDAIICAGPVGDVIGTIDGPTDVPTALWSAWTMLRAKGHLTEHADLVDMHQRIRDAGMPYARLVTKAQLYAYLKERRESSDWPGTLAKAWDDSINEWVG